MAIYLTEMVKYWMLICRVWLYNSWPLSFTFSNMHRENLNIPNG